MICKKRHRIKVLLKKYTQGTQELDIQIMIMLPKKNSNRNNKIASKLR